MNTFPSRFGKYAIIEKIGEGGFGIVYKAKDATLDRIVALKVLKPMLLADPVFLERFRREAKTAAALEHPNIVTIYEVGEEQGMHYLAMRYLSGEPLDKLIAREGALPIDRALHIARQVADALDYAHARGMIHRDVKPSNIIIGENDTATLTDFGLVRSIEGSVLTSSMQMVGTAEYMAPEQLDTERANEVGPRTDLYALGIVVYQMLTGRVPFSGSTSAVIAAQLFKDPPPPTQFRPDLPRQMEAAILKMLAKHSAERFANGKEFIAALERTQESAVPVSPEPIHPLWPSPRIPPMLTMAGVGILLAIIGLITAAILFGTRSGNQIAIAPTATPSATVTVTSSATVTPTAMTTVPTPAPTGTPVVIVVTATPVPPTATSTATATPVGPQKRLDQLKDNDGILVGVQVTDLTTGKETRIYSSRRDCQRRGYSSATWSIDGTRILVSSPCDYGSLREVGNDGKVIGQRIVSEWGDDYWGSIIEGLWSPNDQRVAGFFINMRADKCPFILDPSGRTSWGSSGWTTWIKGRKLNMCDPKDHPRYWSVDGKWIITWSEMGLKFYAYEVDGNRRVPLEQLGKIQVYDQRYWPWRVTDSPVCKGASFWDCE